MKNDLKKHIFYTSGFVVLSVMLVGCSGNVMDVKEEVSVEYGQPISLKVEDYLDKDKMEKDELDSVLKSAKLVINGDKKENGKGYQAIGEYTVKISYEEEEAEVKVSV